MKIVNLPGENQKSENQKLENPNKKSGIIVFLLLLLVVAFVAVLMYLKSENIDIKNIELKSVLQGNFLSKAHENADATAFEFSYETKEFSVFSAYKDYVIKCTKDSIRGLDKKGQEQWVIPVTMSNPIIKTSGNDLVVGDLGGRDVYVINGKTVKWNKKMENNITNIDISESGHVAVVQEIKGYKNGIVVFNLQGNEFFTRLMAENFVLTSKVSPTGKHVVINSVDISGVKASSNIEFTDMFGKQFAASMPIEGVLFPSVWHINEENVIVVSDSSIVSLSKPTKGAGKELWRQEYSNKKIYSSGVLQGKYAVIAVEGDKKTGIIGNGTTEITLLTNKGQKSAECTIPGKVLNIETCGDIIAANTGNEVYFINAKGNQIGKYSSKSEITGIHFFNKQEIEVVTKTSVVVTKIK